MRQTITPVGCHIQFQHFTLFPIGQLNRFMAFDFQPSHGKNTAQLIHWDIDFGIFFQPVNLYFHGILLYFKVVLGGRL